MPSPARAVTIALVFRVRQKSLGVAKGTLRYLNVSYILPLVIKRGSLLFRGIHQGFLGRLQWTVENRKNSYSVFLPH